MSEETTSNLNDEKDNNDDDNDSDEIQLLGIEIDEDDNPSEGDEDDNDDALVENLDSKPPAQQSSNDLDMETVETEEIEEARRERVELLKAAEKKSTGVHVPSPDDQQQSTFSTKERLEYLIAQSDVFAQFLAGSVAANSKKGKKDGSRGKTGRMTEEEEDALLLKSAQSKRHTVVRLDKQPSCMSPACKMHPYQLEGLNWMIKLHDHGINGILADGK